MLKFKFIIMISINLMLLAQIHAADVTWGNRTAINTLTTLSSGTNLDPFENRASSYPSQKFTKVKLTKKHYNYSEPGFSISIPLSQQSVQTNLSFIILYISIAGQEHSFVYPPIPNQMALFTWNGKDENGNKLNGTQTIKIHVGYKYQSNLNNIENTIRKNKNGSITIEKNKDSVTYWHSWTDLIGSWDSLRSIITLLDT